MLIKIGKNSLLVERPSITLYRETLLMGQSALHGKIPSYHRSTQHKIVHSTQEPNMGTKSARLALSVRKSRQGFDGRFEKTDSKSTMLARLPIIHKNPGSGKWRVPFYFATQLRRRFVLGNSHFPLPSSRATCCAGQESAQSFEPHTSDNDGQTFDTASCKVRPWHIQ